MEVLVLSFGAAMLLGLGFGAGPCNITCLPYLGPVMLADGGAWRIVLPFSLGRLSGYAALGAVAGVLGEVVTRHLESGPVGLLLGGASIFLGVMLWRRAGRGSCSVGSETAVAEVEIRPLGQRTGKQRAGGLFAMGAGMALNPCAPLGTVLLAAAFTGNLWDGLRLGLAFGLGAVLLPTLIFALLVAHFAAQVRAHLLKWQARLERGAGLLLITLGLLTAAGWIHA